MISNINLWRDIEEYLDKKYPERWDITMNAESPTEGFLVIHYPEIEMTNTPGAKHKITDLFVRLPLCQVGTARCLTYSSIQGMRMSASEGELQGRYVHSHLSSRNPENFNNFTGFCLGSGPIKRHWQKCSFPNFTLIDFKLLMINLDTYVAYESTNTNPYTRFQYLSGGESYKKTNIRLSEIKTYVSNIDHPDKIKVFCKTSKAVVKKFPKEAYLNIQDVFPNKHLVSKSADGKYWSVRDNYRSRPQLEEEVSRLRFTFRGKELKFKITTESTNRELFIHPDVENAIKNYIENEFNYATWLGRYINT